MSPVPAYHIKPLSENCLLLDFGNQISPSINDYVIAVYRELIKKPLPFMREVVPAYSSLAIYYDIFSMYQNCWQKNISAFDSMKQEVEKCLTTVSIQAIDMEEPISIPVCYDPLFGPDLAIISKEKKIDREAVIALHCKPLYRVYMIGFSPGFPYLGMVDEAIAMPRKDAPRSQVAAGSVGIAGRQTGIYPQASPGGWQIIGRTPLVIFDKGKEKPALLSAGCRVKFYPISKQEFDKMAL